MILGATIKKTGKRLTVKNGLQVSILSASALFGVEEPIEKYYR
jgi:hypothetical protein